MNFYQREDWTIRGSAYLLHQLATPRWIYLSFKVPESDPDSTSDHPVGACDRPAFSMKILETSENVYNLNDVVQKPLQQSSDDPYRLIMRLKDSFEMDYIGKQDMFSVNRLKSVHLVFSFICSEIQSLMSDRMSLPASLNVIPAGASVISLPPSANVQVD